MQYFVRGFENVTQLEFGFRSDKLHAIFLTHVLLPLAFHFPFFLAFNPFNVGM
jgi:hypothetical protein